MVGVGWLVGGEDFFVKTVTEEVIDRLAFVIYVFYISIGFIFFIN